MNIGSIRPHAAPASQSLLAEPPRPRGPGSGPYSGPPSAAGSASATSALMASGAPAAPAAPRFGPLSFAARLDLTKS